METQLERASLFVLLIIIEEKKKPQDAVCEAVKWLLLNTTEPRERARDRIYDLLIHFLNIRCCCGWTNIKKEF